MPVTIKSANVKYKNSQGEYVGVNSVSDNTTADQITAIQNAGAGQVTAVQNKGAEVLASIPDPYEDLANEVDDLSSAYNGQLVDTLIDGWKFGMFDSTTGEEAPTDTRIINRTSVGLSTGVGRITVDSGFAVLLFAWDINGTFIGSFKSTGIFDKTISNFAYVTDFDTAKFPNYVYKPMLRRVGSSSISLSDSVNCHYHVLTDKTLLLPYKAADAEETGNQIAALKYELHLVANGNDLKKAEYIKASDGTPVASSTWISTDFIDISAFKYLSVKMSNAFTAVDAGFAFYDQAQAYISGVPVIVDSTWTQENQSMSVFNVDIPSGAKYIRASSRITNKDDFSIKSRSGEAEIDTNLPTPIIFFEKNPVTPSAGYENRVLIDKFVDVENIAICARIDVTATTVVFMGTEDFRGQQHASHVQYDFSAKAIRVYTKGTGQAIPSTVLQTIDFSALGNITYAQIYIGRKNRQLWVAVENYETGMKTEYLVSDGDSYDYPAGWLADRLVYGVITGTATYKRITATTKVSPFIAFIGDSITEGYGIPYDKSWSYQVGSEIGDFLCMGRSGGTVVTAQRQVDDIISKIKPKYVVVCIGTNGGNTFDNIRALCESIRYYGSFPILCRIPTTEYYSTSANVNNNTISPQNENTVGMDYATSILSSGAQDTSKFLNDRLHPNVAGATAMAERFMVDAGWIVIQ